MVLLVCLCSLVEVELHSVQGLLMLEFVLWAGDERNIVEMALNWS